MAEKVQYPSLEEFQNEETSLEFSEEEVSSSNGKQVKAEKPEEKEQEKNDEQVDEGEQQVENDKQIGNNHVEKDPCDPPISNSDCSPRRLKRRPIIRDHESKKESSRLPNTTAPERKSCSYSFYLKILLLLAVFGILSTNDNVRNTFGFFGNRRPNRELLMKEFFNQTDSQLDQMGEMTIKAAVGKDVDDHSIILLLIAGTNQELQLQTFAKKLANLTTLLKTGYAESDPVTFSLDTLQHGDEIEAIYHQTFVEQEKPVLILEHLESMPVSIAMRFHQYVDNDQSKIRSSFSIVTVKSDLIHKYSAEDRIDTISSAILRELWSTVFEVDGLESLINRMAEFSVILRAVAQ